jgi:hypothetical protein
MAAKRKPKAATPAKTPAQPMSITRRRGEEFTTERDYAKIARAFDVEIDDAGAWLDKIGWRIVEGPGADEHTLHGTRAPGEQAG